MPLSLIVIIAYLLLTSSCLFPPLALLLSHHPSCSLTLCPSLLRSILLYLAPPHLISYSKQKENTERSPIDFFPVHVFQTAFSLINWGKWLRTSAPGPVPYIPFSFASMSSALASYLSSRGFTSPSPSSPFPFLLFFFPSSTFPSSSSTCSLPAKPGRTGGFFSSVSLEPPPFYLPLYCTLHPYLSPNTSLFHCTASSYTRQGERFGPRPHGLSPSS